MCLNTAKGESQSSLANCANTGDQPGQLAALTVLIGTGSCGTRTRDCFHPRWRCWQLLCWVEGWRRRRCPGCCRVSSRGGPSPPAAAPPAPAAALTAVASGAAGAGRPKALTSLFAPPLRAAHLTAETAALWGGKRVLALAVSKLWLVKTTLWTPERFDNRTFPLKDVGRPPLKDRSVFHCETP